MIYLYVCRNVYRCYCKDLKSHNLNSNTGWLSLMLIFGVLVAVPINIKILWAVKCYGEKKYRCTIKSISLFVASVIKMLYVFVEMNLNILINTQKYKQDRMAKEGCLTRVPKSCTIVHHVNVARSLRSEIHRTTFAAQENNENSITMP